MSRIDDLLTRSAAEVRDAVERMPEREVTTVETAHNRKTVLTAAGAVAGVIIVLLLGWALFGFGGREPDVPPIDDPIPVDSDAMPLPAPPARINAGTYVTDVLGPAFSFDVANYGSDDGWFLQVAGPGEVAISHPLSEGPGDRDMWFGHPDQLSDPEDPFSAGWDVGDLEGWLDANADWVVDEAIGTRVGGRQATMFTLRATNPCRDPESPGDVPCPVLVFDGDDGALWLENSVLYEVWWIHDVEGSPFVIAAGAATWTDEFRANVNGIVATWAAGRSDGSLGVEASTVEADADFRWEYTLDSGEVVVLAGDLPSGFPARTWRGQNLDATQGVGAEPGLHNWVTNVEPMLPEPAHTVDLIIELDDACAELHRFALEMNPQEREAPGNFLRALVFTEYAIDRAVEIGCVVGEWGTDGAPPAISEPTS